MYKDFYGFLTYPFDETSDSQFLYPSDTYKDCLSCLLQGLQRGYGVLVMTGAIGTGKTFLLHTLLQNLDETTHAAFLVSSTFNALEILQYAAKEFRLEFTADSKAKLLLQLRDFLVTQATSNEKAVLIVDEAQNLSVEVLEDLRLLTNFERAEKKLIHIILVGHLSLEETLKCPELIQLRQRVGRRCRLLPLNDDETKEYIERRLAVAGATEPLFTPQAIKAVYLHSQGIPRVINTICDGALLFGFRDDTREIGPWTIQAVMQDLHVYTPEQVQRSHTRPQRDTPVRPASGFRRPSRRVVLAALAVVSLLGAGVLWHSPLVSQKGKESAMRSASSPAVVPPSPAYREPPLLPYEPAYREPPASHR
jgi:general secretion pathway protein A